MQHRDTTLESRLPAAPYVIFILFPLPSSGSEYRDYLARVRARFPPGKLRTIVREGREFTTGLATDLPVLFPVAAPMAAHLDTQTGFGRGPVAIR
jgi:hypothetical protein